MFAHGLLRIALASVAISLSSQLASGQTAIGRQTLVAAEKADAPGGGKFGQFEAPVIGEGGHIGFVAMVSDTLRAVFTGSPRSLRRLMSEGDPVPGDAEGMRYRVKDSMIWLNPKGHPTVYANGVFVASDATGKLVTLSMLGRQAPHYDEGLKMGGFSPFVAGDWAAWRVQLLQTPGVPKDQSSIMAARHGKSEVLLREGTKPRGVEDADAKLKQLAGPDTGISAGGFIVQKAWLDNTDERGTEHLLIGMVPGKGHAVLVRSGSPSPAEGWIFGEFRYPSPDDSGAFVFKAGLSKAGERGGSGGFFYRDKKGEVHKIFMGGDPVPGVEGKTFKHDFGWARCALSPKNSHAVLKAEIDEIDRKQKLGYWRWSSATGKLELIVQWGQQAPGLAEGITLKDVLDIAVNSAGQVAFLGRLSGDERKGIWAGTPGDLKLVAVQGEPLELDGDEHGVAELLFAKGTVAGQRAGLNEKGQVVYAAWLDRKRWAVVLADIR